MHSTIIISTQMKNDTTSRRVHFKKNNRNKGKTNNMVSSLNKNGSAASSKKIVYYSKNNNNRRFSFVTSRSGKDETNQMLPPTPYINNLEFRYHLKNFEESEVNAIISDCFGTMIGKL